MVSHTMHPIAAITQATTAYSYPSNNQPIKIGLDPIDFVLIEEQMKSRIKKYDLLTDAAMTSHSLTDDTTILLHQDEGKRDIVKSAFNKEFADRYKNEIRWQKTYENLLEFLKEVIGVKSKEQKSETAAKQLTEATRMIDEDEKYERFLNRLKHIATDIDEVETTKTYLVEVEFKKNLTRANTAFLKENHFGKEKSCLEKARYLDQMDKHRKPLSVNSIDITASTELKELREMYKESQLRQTQMYEQMHALTVLMKNKSIKQDDAIDRNTHSIIEVNKISTSRPRQHITNSAIQPHTTPQNRSFNKQHSRLENPQQHNVNNYPEHWEINRYGAPYRCRRCGIRGHRDLNCKGTDKSCDECGQIGHIKPACPKRPAPQFRQQSNNKMSLN